MEGNEAGLPEQVLAEMSWVRELSRGLLGSSSDADDVAQEVWIAANEAPPRGVVHLRGWLAAVTRNAARAHRRGESRRRARELAAARGERLEDESELVARGETCRRVVAAVMALEEPYRSTVLRRYLDGWSSAEIAARDGVDDAAIRKRLSRAMQELRARLDREFEGGRSAWVAALFELRGESAAAAGPAAAIGGMLLVKKIVAACVLVLLVAVGSWIALARANDPQGGERVAIGGAAGTREPATDSGHALEAVQGANPAGTRAGATSNARIVVHGSVWDLSYPDPGGAATPASSAKISASARVPGFMGDIESKAETETDARGAFTIELDDSGKRPLDIYVAAAEDALYRTAFRKFELRSGEPPIEVRLERAAHGNLSGLVVDDRGEPIAGAKVESPGPPAQVVTGTDGRFLFRHVKPERPGFSFASDEVQVRKDGYRRITGAALKEIATGGWQDVRVTLFRSDGKLALRVVDGAGAPARDVHVAVFVSSEEPDAHAEPFSGRPAGEATIEGTSDADGRLRFDGVWTNRELVVQVESENARFDVKRSREGRAEATSAESGRAIVVPEGGELALEIVLPGSVRLRGRVIGVDGVPLAAAKVSLKSIGARPADAPRRTTFTADAEGRFDQPVRRPSKACRYQVQAASGPEDMLGFYESPGVERALAEIEISPATPPEVQLEIRLRATLSISGTVHDREGSSVAGSIVAIPSGSRSGDYARFHAHRIDADGAFRIDGLLPGPHRLEVRSKESFVFTEALVSESFPPVEAGTEGHALVFDPKVARVALELAAPGDLAGASVMIAMLDPFDEATLDAPIPAAELRFSGLRGWPRAARSDFGGQGGALDELGTMRLLHLAAKTPVHELQPLSPGWYVLGVEARDAEGRKYHPSGTGLVRLEPGDYRFRFDLEREARVEGRLVFEGEHDELSLALVDAEGRAIQLRRTSARVDEIVPTGADGRFVLDGAPPGTWKLRVGREEDLRRGVFVHEQPVTIAAGKNEPIEIRVP
jgi:RNA polymerase sigma factor (sigma-70 family)